MDSITLRTNDQRTQMAPQPSLIADFRLLNYTPRHSVWFAAVPRIVDALKQYGEVNPTVERGVYLLSVHPLVDFHALITELEKISGMRMGQ